MSGAVVWFTGLPSSGKTTLARAVKARLDAGHRACCLLDGDEVRSALVPGYGYSERERRDFYESLARLAALLAAQGLVVLVPATAHRAFHRRLARGIAPHFVEVYLAVPLDVCRVRDAKGLYRSPPPSLPGVGVSYETPTEPEVVASGGHDQAAIERIVALIS